MSDTLLVMATLGPTRALWWKALRAAFAWADPLPHAFVVLDEPSQEDEEWLRGLMVTVDTSPVRRGLVGAWNVGFRYFREHPEYQYLLLLEEGVVVDNGWDVALRKTLVAHPEFGWVGCGQQENEKAKFTAYCSLLHRQAVEAVGGLDPRFSPAYFDDGDLFVRLQRAGYHPHGVSHLVSHPVSRTSRSWSPEADALLLLEKRLLFHVIHGLPDFTWDAVPVHVPCEACV